MNFSIHVDDVTLERLAAAVERSGLTRNRIIVQAVKEWLERNEEPSWPEALKEHFRNPAPELALETVDALAWRESLAADATQGW
jgi:predicted transcriptional regulator